MRFIGSTSTLVGLLAAALVFMAPSSQAADSPNELRQPRGESRPTAKLVSVRYDRRASAYVVRAAVALSAVKAPKTQRAKTSLEATVRYAVGGKKRNAKKSVKLSTITIVQEDPRKGIAVVEIRATGDAADQMKSVSVSVELVGANPTPYP